MRVPKVKLKSDGYLTDCRSFKNRKRPGKIDRLECLTTNSSMVRTTWFEKRFYLKRCF